MSTTRFICRTDKPDKRGICHIDLIYQIAKDTKKLYTGIKLYPDYWLTKDQLAIYIQPGKIKKKLKELPAGVVNLILLDEQEIDEVNDKLAAIRLTIGNIEKRFELDKIPYNAEMVSSKYRESKTGITKAEEKFYLLDFVAQFIEDHSATREPGTIETYKALETHLKDFQATLKNKIKFEDVDYGFFQRFQNYLVNTDDLNNSTIAKKLSILKTMLSYARKNGIKLNDSYRDFTIKRAKIEVVALTQDEFDRLLNKDFSKNLKLDRVRDVFCFSCATGLRMSDMAQLKREHIKNDYINLVVKKTKTELTIPLNKISAGILAKYADQADPLPIISNQKLNEYIKDACKLADIDEKIEIVRFKGPKRDASVFAKHQLIHIHTGRKTFVTLSLEKGMSAEQVMAITGHTDYKSFKKYVDITKKLSKVVMVKAWGEVPKLKAV